MSERVPIPIAAFIAVCALATHAIAQPDSRVVAARSTSAAAGFASRPTNGNQFRLLPEKADLYAGDLLVTLPGSSLLSRNGALSVHTPTDYNARSPLPILETAFTLRDGKETDLDLVLDRGRIDVTNVKSSGAAAVSVRFWDQHWKIVLDSPQSRVAVELCGRWPSGTRFQVAGSDPDPAKSPSPVASLVLLVLNGTASVDVGGVTLAMKAPPGPAELRWNSLTGARPQPLKLEKLPDWADAEATTTPDGKKHAQAVEKFRAARATDPAKAVQTFLQSADPIEQRIALVTLGALDDLEALGRSLVAAKTAEQWDFGITVLRHWLGRGRGQDQRYYEILTTTRNYTPGQAKTIMQLLFGFSAEAVAQPETYEVLIDYLVHEKPAIRNLAAWHLVRLVPAGKAIEFVPDGTAADAERAHAAWKKLVPAGQLPPAPKEKRRQPEAE